MSGFDDEMQDALMADAQKLRDMGVPCADPVFFSTADDIRQATERGLYCAECGCEFTKEHGFKVACGYCFRRMTVAEIADAGIRLAKHEESNKAAHANEARKRKARRARS